LARKNKNYFNIIEPPCGAADQSEVQAAHDVRVHINAHSTLVSTCHVKIHKGHGIAGVDDAWNWRRHNTAWARFGMCFLRNTLVVIVVT